VQTKPQRESGGRHIHQLYCAIAAPEREPAAHRVSVPQLVEPRLGDRADTFLCMHGTALSTSSLPFSCTEVEVVRARGWAVYAAYRLHNGIRKGRHDQGHLGSAFNEYYRRAQIASTEDDA